MKTCSQRGVSLLSLLIGLVISMIAVLGVTSLFRTVIKNNTEASQNARVTAERAAAMLIADMHLADAGFGLEGSLNINLLLLQGAELKKIDENDENSFVEIIDATEVTSISGEGNALIWRFDESALTEAASYTCAGLYASDDGIGYLSLPSGSECNSVSEAFNDKSDWKLEPLVERGPKFSIEIKRDADCSSFGIAGNSQVQVTIRTSHKIGDGTDDEIELSSTSCLLNFSS